MLKSVFPWHVCAAIKEMHHPKARMISPWMTVRAQTVCVRVRLFKMECNWRARVGSLRVGGMD